MALDKQAILEKWAAIVAQSWLDETLRRRLLEEPAAVLREHGVELPENTRVQAVEGDVNTLILPTPRRPEGMELSEEELEAVAGGLFGTMKKVQKSLHDVSMTIIKNM